MLGLAAGDTAGGAWELGYSAVTEQATVIAYHLIEHDGVERESIIRQIRELDGSGPEVPVYRAETARFRAWLDRAAAGSPTPDEDPSLDGVARAIPVGVAKRRSPSELRSAVLEVERLFQTDTESLVCAVAAASAVAAACFGQSGRDLIAGVAESLSGLGTDPVPLGGRWQGEVGPARAEELRRLIPRVGVRQGAEALGAVGAAATPTPWELTSAGILLAAPAVDRAHLPVEQAARIGGSVLAAMVGGVVGARVGIRAWPWAFANDTWFAEIGRRLVRGPNDIRDLPIPYAVEHHLISGQTHR